MSTAQPLKIASPVGRIVGGSLYEPRTKDYDGNPLVYKSGDNVGKPRGDYNFGVAFPKTPGVQNWYQETWLAPIYGVAQASFPSGEYQRNDFAWKITDGDSLIPNKRGKKPAEQEGYKGHWVIWFSGSNMPRVFRRPDPASQWVLAVDQQGNVDKFVRPGYYVTVAFTVTDNKPSKSAGLYMNHSIVGFVGFGTEITFGPDANEAFSNVNLTLPPGASMMPSAGAPLPGTTAAPAPLIPNAGVPAAAAAPVKKMTAKANGATYEQFVANQWTDQMMLDQGYMVIEQAAPAIPLVGSVPAASVPVPTVAAPPQLVVTPNPAILAVPVKEMTAKAGGATYEQFVANKWTDQMMIDQGYMVIKNAA